MQEIMEIARFGVAAGIDAAEVAAQSAQVTAWAARQPGFVSRALVGPDADGRWMDLVRWKTKADALAAAGQIGAAPEVGGFLALIDPQTVEMLHLPIVASS